MLLNPFELEEIHSLAALLPAFEFDGLIAQGGMGAVYKARQRSLDRNVAIKILSRELGDDPLFRSSFQAEAKAMARLNHPNLIRVYDSGDLDGLLYIVMEYVPGKSLFHSAYGKAIDFRQAVEIVIATCRGLAHAHENGIIHRDIKPANILLTLNCEPKIGDFGLARCTRSDADGLAMGTPEYMAPEVIDQPAKGDPHSDVFAVGVVLRELLTGIPAGTEDAAKQVVSDLKLDAICRTATHADPALRYPDASSLAEQLTRWMAEETSKASVATRPPTTQRPASASHQPKPAIYRPKPSSHQPKPASLARQGTSGKWALMKNCAIVVSLLGSCGLTWAVHQAKHDAIARLQREQGAPIQSVEAESNPVARFNKSGDLVSARSAVIKETSLESLVRFGTSLVAGNPE